MGLADVGAGASRAFAVRFLGALDQTTVGGKRLDPREAVDGVDFVEPYETENLAAAWDGVPQIQGVGIMLCGGFEDGQFHVAEPLVVVVNQGKVDCDPLVHGGLGTPLRDTSAVRLLGELLADFGPVILASGILDVGEQLRPCVHQRPAAPEEISRGPHLGRVHRGLGHQAATQEPGNCMGVDRVVCGLTPMDRLQVQGMAEDERDAFVSPEVGQPGPR